MPNMKEVCKTLDRMQKSIDSAFVRIDQLAKLIEVGQFFGGGAQAAPVQPPSSTSPGSEASASPVPPPAPTPRPRGPRPFMDASVFTGHEKQAPESKRKEFRDVFGNEQTENDFIRKVSEEIFKEKYSYEIDKIDIGDQASPSKKKSEEFRDPTQDMKKMVEEYRAEFRKTIGEFKRTSKEDMSNMTFGLLSNVFGRRIVNMLTPDKLHGGDLLYMAQNIRWIDGKVQDVISKSIAEKVASGQMTKAAAANAGGFMSGEAIGAQLAGGALIGLFIAKHIPKLIDIVKDVSELKDSVNVMMTGDRTFSATTRDLQKAAAWATTIDKSAEKTDEMLGSRTMLGMKVDAEGARNLRAHLHKIMADEKFLNSAIKQFTENAADSSVFRTGFLRGFSKIWKFA